mgnify:CR=1 FL=1|jgi:hypothetical protein
MSKLDELKATKELMIKHLRELSKLSMKANIKHHTVIEKNLSHTIEITKFMKEDRAKIDRLNNVIDIKQREIDELNSKNTDLLFDAAKLEQENILLKKEIEADELKAAQVQKNLKKYLKNESIDN